MYLPRLLVLLSVHLRLSPFISMGNFNLWHSCETPPSGVIHLTYAEKFITGFWRARIRCVLAITSNNEHALKKKLFVISSSMIHLSLCVNDRNKALLFSVFFFFFKLLCLVIKINIFGVCRWKWRVCVYLHMEGRSHLIIQDTFGYTFYCQIPEQTAREPFRFVGYCDVTDPNRKLHFMLHLLYIGSG